MFRLKSTRTLLFVFAALFIIILAIQWQLQKFIKQTAYIPLLLRHTVTPVDSIFISHLTAHSGKTTLFDTLITHDNPKALDQVWVKLRSHKPALVYTYGTFLTKETVIRFPDMPVVFTMVSNPVKSGISPGWGPSGNNATGVCHLIHYEDQYRTLKAMIRPEKPLKTLGILYEEPDPNSGFCYEEAVKWGKEHGFKTNKIFLKDKESIDKTIDAAAPAVDYVYWAAGFFMLEHAKTISQALIRNKLPSYAINKALVKNGALLGRVSEDADIGGLAAEKALAIIKGETPGTIPVQTLPMDGKYRSRVVVNTKTAGDIGYEIPKTLREQDILLE
jgi:putative ABC transport system substrate-binding protein